MFFISPENNYRLSNESNSVLLIGGFGGWWNFGDVLQLKSTLDRYVGYERIILVHLSSVIEEKSLSKLKDVFSDAIPLFYGSESQAKTFEDLYGIELQEPEVNLKVLHVYGGGFLNEFWGKGIIEIAEKALHKFKPKKYVITGQQISSKIVDSFRKHVDIYKPAIVGVRDYKSLECLRKAQIEAEFSWDDSIEEIVRIKKLIKPVERYNDAYGIHLNLSDYVVKDLGKIKEKIKQIMEHFKDKEPIFFQSYSRSSVIVKDTIKSIEYLGLGDFIRYFHIIDLMNSYVYEDWESLKGTLPGIGCVFSNSYHTALFFAMVGVPAYLFCLNDYYRQKHVAVMGEEVDFEQFLDNIPFYAEKQREIISENAGKRKQFIEKLKDILETDSVQNVYEDKNYTYQNWYVEQKQNYEVDAYVKKLYRDNLELISYSKSLEEQLYRANSQREEAEKTIKTLKMRNEALKSHNLLLSDSNIKLRKEFENREIEIKGLREELEWARSQLYRANSQREEAEKTIKTLKMRNEALKSHNLLLSDSNIKLRKEFENREIEIKGLREELEWARSQLYQIWNSNSWKLLSRYWKLRDESVLRFVIRPVRYVILKIMRRI